jgi:pyridoxal phosphate enzyme (YggS family)
MAPEWMHVAEDLREVEARIGRAARAAGRKPEEVTLVAVSKTFPAESIRAAVACGQRHFGENYVQEARAKQNELVGLDLVWHFIGPIQGNKTREIAAHFDWVHGVDRGKIARRLAEQRPDGLTPLNVCIQVNISGEASKSGVAPEELAALAGLVSELPRLKLRGLMAIPEPGGDPRPRFRLLRTLRDELNAQGLALDTLSMGMSGDFEIAIAEGATMIRVGSAIFGKRNYA